MELLFGSDIMDRYTASGDYELEKKVNEVIELIKNEIIDHAHPKSIIIKGSFGKGEITVLNEDQLKFLSDCEIVIKNNRFNACDLSKLAQCLSQKTGLSIEIGDIELELKFCLFLNLKSRILPTIDNYELEYGSKVIYGENFLSSMPKLNSEDISTWEGIRLILNRMIESSCHFSSKYFNNYPSEFEERVLFFWINKILLACQDALLILAKQYHYSYRTRNKNFQKIYPKCFKLFDDQIPNFLLLTKKATAYKLNPKEMYSKNVIDFWFDVAKIADDVFRYLIYKDLGLKFDSYKMFPNAYLSHPYIRKEYYRGLSPNPIYQNLRSSVKMWTLDRHLPTLKMMAINMTPWLHLVYSSIPLVYFSLSRNGSVDSSLLEKVKYNLSIFKKYRQFELNSWDHVNEELFKRWTYVCY